LGALHDLNRCGLPERTVWNGAARIKRTSLVPLFLGTFSESLWLPGLPVDIPCSAHTGAGRQPPRALSLSLPQEALEAPKSERPGPPGRCADVPTAAKRTVVMIARARGPPASVRSLAEDSDCPACFQVLAASASPGPSRTPAGRRGLPARTRMTKRRRPPPPPLRLRDPACWGAGSTLGPGEPSRGPRDSDRRDTRPEGGQHLDSGLLRVVSESARRRLDR
jgi:hypothetical protein